MNLKFCLFFFLMLFATQSAYSADSVVGTWRGSILVDELPVVVRIVVDSLALDEQSMALSYGRPRKCQAWAEYGGSVSQKQIFYFSKTLRNSWCEVHLRPYNKRQPLIKLKLTESGKMNYELFDGKKRLEGGIVERIK